MSNIVENLKADLTKEIKNADEIWVAVALVTTSALDFILSQLSEDTSQNYLIGINLPTEPNALKKLHRLELKDKIKSRIYTSKEFYHPKLYVIRKGSKYVSFIGSANCTNGGLSKNIELSYKIDNQTECKELVKWFEKFNDEAIAITASFLKEYEKFYQKRLERKRADESDAQNLKKKLKQEHEVTMAAKKELIEVLKWHRKQPIYEQHKEERQGNVKRLRESLDYPTFKNINVDAFFSIWELGHLIAIPIPTVKKEINKLRNMLEYLCDDRIDIATRINEVLSGDLKIRGVAEAMISKILTIHNPKEYSIRNQKIDNVLTNYGIQIPKRISKGEKYKAVNTFLIQIAKKSNIDNLAVLDLYLYKEATEND